MAAKEDDRAGCRTLGGADLPGEVDEGLKSEGAESPSPVVVGCTLPSNGRRGRPRKIIDVPLVRQLLQERGVSLRRLVQDLRIRTPLGLVPPAVSTVLSKFKDYDVQHGAEGAQGTRGELASVADTDEVLRGAETVDSLGEA